MTRKAGLAALVTTLVACGPSTHVAVSIQIAGPAFALGRLGQMVQLSAKATFTDATSEDVTARAQWSSSAPAVAVVSAAGVVTAVGNGTTEVSATYGMAAAKQTMTVDLSSDLDWVYLGPVFGTAIDTGVQKIAVDPRDSRVLYVAADSGFFVSRDRGATWSTLHANGTGTHAVVLASDPLNPDEIAYGVLDRLYVSTDQGQTLQLVKTFPDSIRSILFSGLDNQTMFVGTQGPNNFGLFKSTDAGATWEPHAFGYPLTGVSQFIPWDIAEDPVDGTLYVPTELHDHPQPYHPPAFRSIDRGLTWLDMTGILPWHGVRVVVRPGSRDVLFLTEGAGLFRSTNQGVSWTRFGNGSFSSDLQIDPNNSNRLFGGDVVFGARDGGVFLSNDAGATFIAYGLDGRTCGGLAVSADSVFLYAACYNSGIWIRRLPS